MRPPRDPPAIAAIPGILRYASAHERLPSAVGIAGMAVPGPVRFPPGGRLRQRGGI